MPFFFFLVLVFYNSLKRILTIYFSFFPIFGLKQPDFLLKKKKCFFLLSGQGDYPPYTISGPTTKKTPFLCVSSVSGHVLVGSRHKTGDSLSVFLPPRSNLPVQGQTEYFRERRKIYFIYFFLHILGRMLKF